VSDDAGTVELKVKASELVAGDVVVLPNGLRRRVLSISLYTEATGKSPGKRLQVIVEGSSSLAFENRARAAKGATAIVMSEQGLRPFKLNELVTVERPLEEL
jgi:hypothetical protein